MQCVVSGSSVISSFKLTWTSLIDSPTGKKKLKDIIPDFREKCTEDLMRLKVNGLFTSAEQNYFERIPETNIFVYLHREYLEGATVSFKSVAHCCKSDVLEEIECIGSCGHDEEADYDLLPFMLANPVLEKLNQNVASHTGRDIAMQLYERVKYVGQNKKYRDDQDRCFCCDSKLYSYDEDTWTERLYYILKNRYSALDMEFTARPRGNAANDLIKKRIPLVPFEVHLFHGAPDIIIGNTPVLLESQVDLEGCIENKLASEQTPYKSNSGIPIQSGQIIAYIHQLLVIQALRNLMNHKSCTDLKGYRLYLMRGGKSILFTLCLSPRGMQIKARCYMPFLKPISSICKSIQDFIQSVT